MCQEFRRKCEHDEERNGRYEKTDETLEIKTTRQK
jgi:hypothetical protein